MKMIKAMLIFVLLAGCSTNSSTQTAVETRSTPTSALVMKPSLPPLTPTGSLTVASSLQSLTPETLTNQSSGTFTVSTHCPEITERPAKLPDLLGTLVFSGGSVLNNKDHMIYTEESRGSSVSFWNPQANTITSYALPQEFYYYYYAEAPDKEKLALTQGKTIEFSTDLVILDREGKVVKRIAFPEDWTFFNWWGNEKLLFRQFRNQKDVSKDKLGLVSLDLADEKKIILPSDFPNLYTTEEFLDWGALTIFNPDVPLVLYPTLEKAGKPTFSVLWDLEKKQERMRIAGGEWPAWSPDNRRLLLVVDYERKPLEWHDDIILIDHSGSITRSTFFTKYFENAKIVSPVWSPNNRYAAFLLVTSLEYDTAKLGVLDTETLTVDLFCQALNPFPSRFGDKIGYLHYADLQINSARPIWSPNSKYVLLENYERGISSAFLFDWENDTVTQISNRARPVGWLK